MAPRKDLAKTWWSKQWIHALETRALRDPNRLPRGRTYARRGAVYDLDIVEGQITAKVEGSRAQPYQITIGVRRFRPEEWDSIFEVISSQIGFTADLLTGVVPHDLVADAAHRGVELLPEAGDLAMNCSCPDWAVPCKHLAAVCYMTASALDADPFQILLLRGRSRRDVEEKLQAERSLAAAPAAEAERAVELAASMWDVPAVDVNVFSTIGRSQDAANSSLNSASLPSVLEQWAAIGADRDGQLAADVVDAAARAALCLAEGRPAVGPTELLPDAARRASDLDPSCPDRALLARRCDITPGQLEALATSWLKTGSRGVRVANRLNMAGAEDWTPIDPILADVARQVLSDSGARVRVTTGWLTVVGSKLRIVADSEDSTWFAVRKRSRNWVVLGHATLDEIADLANLED
ncbi:MAG: putative Zn finger protein [Acidimicrobiales bacterium]|jgi:uncharacterized Zn finger protein